MFKFLFLLLQDLYFIKHVPIISKLSLREKRYGRQRKNASVAAKDRCENVKLLLISTKLQTMTINLLRAIIIYSRPEINLTPKMTQ